MARPPEEGFRSKPAAVPQIELRSGPMPRARCFWIETAEANGLDDKPLQKIRNPLSSSHEQSCPSAWPRPRAPVRRFSRQDKSAEKNCSRFMPRNPLISLNSDERIQGNQRKSNPHKPGLRSKTARSQENPNGSTRPTSRPAAEKEPNRLYPNATPPARWSRVKEVSTD